MAAGFVTGIGDRHHDNMMMRTGDSSKGEGAEFVYIDFGYVFGEKAGADTSDFPLPQGLKEIIKDEGRWEEYKEKIVEAIKILRPYNQVFEAFLLRMASTSNQGERWANYVISKLSMSERLVKIRIEEGTRRSYFKTAFHTLETVGVNPFNIVKHIMDW